MDRQYSEERPIEVKKAGMLYVLNYDIRALSEEEIQSLWTEISGEETAPDDTFKESHTFGYYTKVLPVGQWSRDGIVNAIIRDKYRIDEMEAITNNMAAITAVFMQTLVSDGIVAATKYLKDSINDDNTKRFKEMQEWRAMAKKVASEIIKD